jgi:soluble lytic murein transglycosylase-like protein
LKRFTLFALLMGLGFQGVCAQLAYYVDEQGRRVFVNPEPKKETPAPAPANAAPKRFSRKQLAALNAAAPVRTVAFPQVKPVSYTPPPPPVASSNTTSDTTSKTTSSPAPIELRGSLEAVVEQTAKRHDVDANLVKAMIKTESNGNSRAVSSKGALGLMQLMPFTAHDLGVTNVFDPVENVEGGVRYLKSLLTQFGGDLSLSLAAYNAGPGAVTRHGGVPPYRETQDYVRKIGSLYGSLRSPAKENQFHGIVRSVDENGKVRYTNLP